MLVQLLAELLLLPLPRLALLRTRRGGVFRPLLVKVSQRKSQGNRLKPSCSCLGLRQVEATKTKISLLVSCDRFPMAWLMRFRRPFELPPPKERKYRRNGMICSPQSFQAPQAARATALGGAPWVHFRTLGILGRENKTTRRRTPSFLMAELFVRCFP